MTLSEGQNRSRGQFRRKQVIELGDAWGGNSVNCVPFRIDAMVTRDRVRHLAFYDAAGDIVVARQEFNDGKLTRVRLANDRKPFDAHQCISLGMDHSGRLHLAFGAHASTLLTTRTIASDIRDGFRTVRAAKTRATYPMFVTTDAGELHLLYRRGRHYHGAILADHFLGELDRWEGKPRLLISGNSRPWTAGPYLNTPVVADDGTIHFFLVWRLPTAATTAGAVANVGIDYVRSADGLGSMTTVRGVGLTLPVSNLTAERVVAVPLGASLINQGTAAMLAGNRPAFLTYWDDGDGRPQYRLGWWDGASWRVSTVSEFRTTFRLDGGGTLPLPHSRPELLGHKDGRVTILYRSEEDGNRLVARTLMPPDFLLSESETQVLVDEDLGFYEPIVDRSAWRASEDLTVYVQRCEQGRGRDGKKDEVAMPAWLMSWGLETDS